MSDLSPEAENAIKKVRRLMMIASLTTFLAVAAVLAVIGYRFSRGEGSVAELGAFVDVTSALPAGAKILSTAVGADHIVVTIEVNGAVQLLTFDPDTLKSLGRLQFKAP